MTPKRTKKAQHKPTQTAWVSASNPPPPDTPVLIKLPKVRGKHPVFIGFHSGCWMIQNMKIAVEPVLWAHIPEST